MSTKSNMLNWLKWLAITSMFLDHFRYAGEDFAYLYYPGRLAFPIFAVLCGWNAMYNTRNEWKFLFRVFVLALITEAFYNIALNISPIPEPRNLNPVFTLSLGLLICNILKNSINLLPLCILLMPLAQFVNYSYWGVILVILGAFINKPYILVCFIPAGMLLNTVNLLAMSITTTTCFLLFYLFTRQGDFPKCYLPNSRWLYLSFPFSFLPPIIYLLIK